MDIKILNEENMPLLKRKVFNFELNFDGKTPTKNEVKTSIASLLKINEELIYIKNIKQRFGERRASVTAHIYKELNDLKDIEEIKKTKKEKKDDKKEEAKKQSAK